MAIFPILVVLGGCVPDGKVGPATAKISSDQFDPDYKILGQHNIFNPFGGTIRDFYLRSFVNKKTLSVSTQIYADISYLGDWRFYQSASDDTATSLMVNVINRTAGDCTGICSMNEVVGIEIPISILSEHVQRGLAVKLVAKSGDSLVLEIPPGQISEQIFQISQIVLQHGGSLSAPANKVSSQSISQPKPQGIVFGIKPVDTPASLAVAEGIKPGIGVFVISVDAESIAEKTGLKPGDIVTRFNGTDISSTIQFRTLLPKIMPGTLIELEVRRSNDSIILHAQF